MGDVVQQGQSDRFARAGMRWLRRRERSGGYRGRDGRRVVDDTDRSPGRLFVSAGLGLLVLVLVVMTGPHWASGTDRASVDVLIAQLDAGAFALALLLAGLSVVWWRLVGDTAMLWLGGAAAIYGLLTLGLGYVAAVSTATGSQELLWLHPASRIVVIALVVRALLPPEVDASLRPSRVIGAGIAATAMVTVGLQVFPDVGYLITASTDAVASVGAEQTPGSLSVVLLWGAAGTWALWRGIHRHRHVFAWFGLLCFALTFAELASLISITQDSSWVAGRSALGVAGLLCAVVGVTGELARAYVRQGSRVIEFERAQVRIEAERAERAHEASNALTAIEGATRTLQLHQEQLDPQLRSELAEAISDEIRRLQQLIATPATPPVPGRFRVTEALAAVVTSARSQGSTVTVDVADHLIAVGQPASTAQVLQNLLQNARRYAGGHIDVRASLEGDQVVIRVEDDGPGIAPEERQRIFRRGLRGTTAGNEPGSGLGLYISARLMHEQGGDLDVEDGASGGACFVVTLPGFSEQSVLLFPPHRQRVTRRIEDQDGVRDDIAL